MIKTFHSYINTNQKEYYLHKPEADVQYNVASTDNQYVNKIYCIAGEALKQVNKCV